MKCHAYDNIMKINNLGAIAATIMTSSICNLNCKYCYIPKNRTLGKIHKEWMSKYFTFDNIVKRIDETCPYITAISFWGGEPTIGISKFNKFAKDIIEYYPRLTSFGTSTNGYDMHSLVELVKILKTFGNERKFDVNIQISIDGPDEIMYHNRGISFKSIEERSLRLIKDLVKLKAENTNIRIHTKATAVLDNYKAYIANPNLLEKNIECMYELHQKAKKIVKKAKHRIRAELFSVPTVECPGSYSKADGKLYSKYHDTYMSIRNKYIKKYNLDILEMNQYYRRTMDLINIHSITIGSKMWRHNLYCSAGSSNHVIGLDGVTNICHDTAWWNYNEYTTEIKDNEDSNLNEYNRNINNTDIRKRNAMGSLQYDNADILAKANTRYIQQSLRVGFNKMLCNTDALIMIASKSGQISKRYSEDEDIRKMLSHLLCQFTCTVGNKHVTGDFFTTPLQTINLYANGFFENIFDAAIESHNKRLSGEIKYGR